MSILFSLTLRIESDRRFILVRLSDERPHSRVRCRSSKVLHCCESKRPSFDVVPLHGPGVGIRWQSLDHLKAQGVHFVINSLLLPFLSVHFCNLQIGPIYDMNIILLKGESTYPKSTVALHFARQSQKW